MHHGMSERDIPNACMRITSPDRTDRQTNSTGLHMFEQHIFTAFDPVVTTSSFNNYGVIVTPNVDMMDVNISPADIKSVSVEISNIVQVMPINRISSDIYRRITDFKVFNVFEQRRPVGWIDELKIFD